MGKRLCYGNAFKAPLDKSWLNQAVSCVGLRLGRVGSRFFSFLVGSVGWVGSTIEKVL